MTIPWPTTGAAIATSLKWAADRADELEDYAAVAVAKIEEKVGPWHGQELKHAFIASENFSAMQLPWAVAETPSVSWYDTPVAVLSADLDSGILHGLFPAGVYVVTARARPAESCPPDIRLAARKLGAHLAKQELVGPRAPGFTSGPDRDVDVQQGFALPRAVSELIADYVPPGSFA